MRFFVKIPSSDMIFFNFSIFNLFLAIVLRLVQIFNKYLTNLRENLYITILESKEHFLLRQYYMLLHDIKK